MITPPTTLPDSNQSARLASLLGCTEAQLPGRLKPFADASLQEYVDMLTGQVPLNRASDILEHRLFLMIGTVFSGDIPSEATVAAYFQKSLSGSRTLITNVLAKYHYQLENDMKRTICNLLTTATPTSTPNVVRIIPKADGIIDVMNRRARELNGLLPPIKREANTVSSYLVDPSTFTALHSYFC